MAIFYLNSQSTPAAPYDTIGTGANDIVTIKMYCYTNSITDVVINVISNFEGDEIDSSIPGDVAPWFVGPPSSELVENVTIQSDVSNIFTPIIISNLYDFYYVKTPGNVAKTITIKDLHIKGKGSFYIVGADSSNPWEKVDIIGNYYDVYDSGGAISFSYVANFTVTENTFYKGSATCPNAIFSSQDGNATDYTFKNNTFIAENNNSQILAFLGDLVFSGNLSENIFYCSNITVPGIPIIVLTHLNYPSGNLTNNNIYCANGDTVIVVNLGGVFTYYTNEVPPQMLGSSIASPNFVSFGDKDFRVMGNSGALFGSVVAGAYAYISQRPVLYVDSLNGSSLNNGDLLSPLKTIGHAYHIIATGGVIVLQEGDGSSYGDILIDKNMSVIAAYGSSPIIGKVTINASQGLLEGLTFDSTLSEGLIVDSNGVGSISIKECYFENIPTPIQIYNVNYISIAQCDFIDFIEGIKILTAKGVNISGNVFARGSRSINVNTVNHLEIYQNTIVDSGIIGSLGVSDTNLRVIYKTLTALDISNKRISLPSYSVPNGYGYDVSLSVTTGPNFYYGEDYTVIGSGSIISWAGLILDGQLEVGEILRVMYSEDTPSTSGEAVRVENIVDPNSRIDSNNFTGLGGLFPDIALGVFFNTPLKIRHNNFYDVVSPYSGSTPTDATGNISLDPLYKDMGTNDYRLQSGSPNIDAADPDKWSDVWLGITGGSIPNATPFNRNKDRVGVRRNYVTPDIGAYEYVTGINPDPETFVYEGGFDFIGTGSETGPYATIDRAFQDLKNLSVHVNPVAGYTGIVDTPGVGRYYSKNISFSGDNRIDIGVSGRDSTALIHPSYPSMSADKVFVSPDGSDITGDGSYTLPYRSINAAIAASPATNIVLFPGLYPEFTGSAGKNLIGIPKTLEINKGGKIISKFLEEEWGLTGTASFDFNVMRVYDNSSVRYRNDLSSPLEAHFKIDSDGDFTLDISNGIHGFAIKKSTTVSICHTVDSVSYSVPAPGLTNEISVDMGLTGLNGVTGAIMSYRVKGSGLTYEKSISLGTPSYTGMQFSVKDVSGDPVEVSSLKIINTTIGADHIEKVYKSTYGIRDEGK